MRARILAASTMMALTLAVATTPAAEAGCIKGAVVGGVVGHFAHRHTLLGAAVGCAIAHHEMVKERREAQRAQAAQVAPQSNTNQHPNH